MSHNLVQLRRHRGDHGAHDTSLQRLARVMHEKRAITEADLAAVARAAGQPEAPVYGVATYYGDLGLAPRGRTRVKVCTGDACHAACGDASVGWMAEALGLAPGATRPDGSVSLETVYCLGFCHAGPTVMIEDRVHGDLTPAKARALAADLGSAQELADDVLVPRFEAHDGPAIVLERLAREGLDATVLDRAASHGAMAGLRRALTELTPEQVLAEVEASGLRGRGGAGFSAAQKWRFARSHALASDEAYVVCNGDEGDPGSFVDKWLMERDPFAVIEGIALAGYAIGATRGFVYVRSEYPRSAPALRRAIDAARRAGLLGARILGSAFSFDVDVVEGAGSYVCGEETALLRSIEGLRGMVTARPPYPAEKGLFERPTVVNNVETLVNVGWIVRHGGAEYAALGTGRSRGTKAFTLNERFVRPGVYEVPLGTSLARILRELGGGMRDGRAIKMVQVGGPLGGILPGDRLDVPVGFEELAGVGAMLGHGGVVAWDDRTDARDVAVHLFEFCAAESCGKCFPCRIGSRRGLEIAQRMREGSAGEGDLALLGELLETMRLGSLCAHGGAIPDPIRSLLDHFGPEMRGGAR